MGDAALKVLIVEDEALLALDMERTINRLGHRVIGPFSDCQDALLALSEERPHLAFLDVNLGDGSNSLLIAERLRDSDVPFAFLTGYARSKTVIGEEFPDVERLAKPCSPDRLADAVARLTT